MARYCGRATYLRDEICILVPVVVGIAHKPLVAGITRKPFSSLRAVSIAARTAWQLAAWLAYCGACEANPQALTANTQALTPCRATARSPRVY